jgi:hypothetical protein
VHIGWLLLSDRNHIRIISFFSGDTTHASQNKKDAGLAG